MRRAPGWTTLAGIALELTALAFIANVVMAREGRPLRRARDDESGARDDAVAAAQTDEAVVVTPQAEAAASSPMDFVRETADDGARYYRACDQGADLIAAFYSDGRVRLADMQDHRFAGMLQGSQADVLELGSNQWSRLLVHNTPAGNLQLELRGGPYDARVLTCEPLTS